MIVRVWGYADAHALEFVPVHADDEVRWEAGVPPDFSDGQYAAELYAMNDAGAQAMWTGILYMGGGVCRFVLRRERYIAWLLPQSACPELLPAHVAFSFTAKEACTHGN